VKREGAKPSRARPKATRGRHLLRGEGTEEGQVDEEVENRHDNGAPHQYPGEAPAGIPGFLRQLRRLLPAVVGEGDGLISQGEAQKPDMFRRYLHSGEEPAAVTAQDTGRADGQEEEDLGDGGYVLEVPPELEAPAVE
jgi:hypothetical protein